MYYVRLNLYVSSCQLVNMDTTPEGNIHENFEGRKIKRKRFGISPELLAKKQKSSSKEQYNPLSGTLYRCPHCSRCMGYSIHQLKRQSRFLGSCVSRKTKDDHFICLHCKIDCTNKYTLRCHIDKFDGLCKQRQIDQSNSYFRKFADMITTIWVCLTDDNRSGDEPLSPYKYDLNTPVG